ncbi:tramtrack-like 2, partial [Homarus americanus]
CSDRDTVSAVFTCYFRACAHSGLSHPAQHDQSSLLLSIKGDEIREASWSTVPQVNCIMEEELLALRWNNHLSTFAALLSDLRNEETYSDVTIACGGSLYPAHKFVLSACSEYLRAMLCAHPNKHPILYLKDVPKEDLEAILDYMYAGTVRVAHSGLASLLRTAEGLQVKGLILTEQFSGHVNKLSQSSTKRKLEEDDNKQLHPSTSYKHPRKVTNRTVPPTPATCVTPSSSATTPAPPSSELPELMRSSARLYKQEYIGIWDEKSNQELEAGDSGCIGESICYSENDKQNEGQVDTLKIKEESQDPEDSNSQEAKDENNSEDQEVDIKDEVLDWKEEEEEEEEEKAANERDVNKDEEEEGFEGFEETEKDENEDEDEDEPPESGDVKDVKPKEDLSPHTQSSKDPNLASFLEVMCTENDVAKEIKEESGDTSYGDSSVVPNGQREGSSRALSQQCPFCLKLLTTRSNLQRHIATHHQRQSFTCGTCGKTFTRKDRLTEHEKLHTGEAPYTCEECGKSFSRRDNLNVHRRTHTGEYYSCCSR